MGVTTMATIERCARCDGLLRHYERRVHSKCRFRIGDRVTFTGERFDVPESGESGEPVAGTWSGRVISVWNSMGELHVRFDDQREGEHYVFKNRFERLTVVKLERGA